MLIMNGSKANDNCQTVSQIKAIALRKMFKDK